MAIKEIQPPDKLNSGFRAKYNETIQRIWVAAEDLGNGTIRIRAHDGATLDVPLTTSFYTKTEISDMLSGVNEATNERAGVIRIATLLEALGGASANTVITPETASALFAANTANILVGTSAPAANQAAVNTLYFQKSTLSLKIFASVPASGGDYDFSWVERGEIVFPGATYTLNNTVNHGITSADLDLLYPNARTGDIVWSETNGVQFIKMGPSKWDMKAVSIQ